MSVCWAERMGDCAGGISREHVISECVLREFEGLRVSGLPWAEGKNLSPKDYVAKILCEKHNSLLAPFDQEAVNVFRAARELVEGKLIARSCNGMNFEKWMLKTIINMCASKWRSPNEGPSEMKWCPRREWLSILFDNKSFKEDTKNGLHFPSRLGATFSGPIFHSGQSLLYLDGKLAGGHMNFGPLHFYLSLSGQRGFSRRDDTMYRPKKIVSKNSFLELKWS